MREIIPIGEVFYADDEGYIESTANLSYIHPIWNNVLADIVEKFKDEYHSSLHSVYLRGSIGMGTAVPGFSDIDVFALVCNEESCNQWQGVAWSGNLEKELCQKYVFVKQIELRIYSFSGISAELNPTLAMILKTQSCCLYGKNVIDHIGRFKIGKEMILNLFMLEDYLAKFRSLSRLSASYSQFSEDLIKILIRSGFELVMQHTKKYTNSLYHCQQEFSWIYPEYAQDMRTLLHFYLNASLCGEKSEKLIFKVGLFILKEAKNAGIVFIDPLSPK